MLLFNGGDFYFIGRRVLEDLRFIFISWHEANNILIPTVQFYFHICVIPIGVVAGCFGTPFGELVFKCWGSALHFGDLLEVVIIFFISNHIHFPDL